MKTISTMTKTVSTKTISNVNSPLTLNFKALALRVSTQTSGANARTVSPAARVAQVSCGELLARLASTPSSWV